MKKILLVALSLLVATPALSAGPELVHSWTKMEWALKKEDKVKFDTARLWEKAPLAGIEADTKGTLYVTTPRWLDARLPSTLSKVRPDGLLEPFPSVKAHDLSNPNAIRNALGVFIDSTNKMWIVDMGWVAGDDSARGNDQKLIAIDLNTGKEVLRFDIGADIANPQTSFLNDIFVDEETQTIYITDSGNRGGAPVPAGIIVYDIKSNTARRVLANHTSVKDDPNLWLKVDGRPVFDGARLAVGINGITRAGEKIWWSVTTGDALYAIPEKLLRDPNTTTEQLEASIEGPIRIGGGSDGIASDKDGRLWITNLALNRVEVLEPGQTQTKILFEGAKFVWPDSLATDFKGGMLLSTNQLNSAFGGRLKYDGNDQNFAVWRIPANLSPTR